MILNEATSKLQKVFDKYAFYCYERTQGAEGDTEVYCSIWDEISKIYLEKRKYKITTVLGTIITLKWVGEDVNNGHTLNMQHD